MPKYGPGTLQFGEVGSEIDASCLVNSCTIEPSKETGDAKTMLCGTQKAGSVTYTYTLTGNLDVDSENSAGLFAFCDENAGAEVPFEYTPNTEAGTTATGVVILDPLAFGGEEYGEDMASDFEFDMVGKPTYDYGGEAVQSTFTRRVVNGTAPTGVKPNPDGTYPTNTDSTDSTDQASTGTSSSKTTSKTSSTSTSEKVSA